MKFCYIFFLALFLFICKFIYIFADTPWSPNVRVSATTGNESTIAVTFPYVYVSYNSNPQRFRLSTDGGINWQPETNFPGSCCDGSMYTDELGYVHITVLFTSPASVRYYRSTNNGTSWASAITLNSGSPAGIDKNWTFNKSNRVYAAWVAYNVGTSEWDMRFAKSDDRGLTFAPQVTVNDGNNISYRQWAVPREDPKDSNTVFVSMTWDRRNFGTGYSPPWQVFVAKSTNGGNNWLPNVVLPDTGHSTQLIGNTPYSITSSIAVSPIYNDVYVVWVDQYTGVSGGKLNVFFSRSTDGGTTFLPRVKLPAAPNPDTSYHFQPWIECDMYGTVHVIWYDTRGFSANSVGGRKGTYYTYSVNRGVTWSPEERVSDTTDNFSGFVGHYQSFTTDSLKIYSTWTDVRNGSANVYYSWRPLPFITGIKPNNKNIVKSFKLNQNYPNPFNPMTTITYELPKQTEIILKVYDELGKEVKTLVSGMQSAGKYEVVWDAMDCSSGIYFYKLTAGNYSDTKRMILVK